MSEDSLIARTNIEPCNDKPSLLKRTYDKKCPCVLATSNFNGKVKGLVVYSQDECGATTVVGIFKSGFKKGHRYDFLITDDCGNPIRNMTADLHVNFVNGGTAPFHAKLLDVSLNCDKYGILRAHTSKPKPPADYNSTVPYKRNNDPCSSKFRKRDWGAETKVYEDASK
ncbi:17474_t:CDS:2 [Dentiscutata erythropus]|uniref:17474_t:CDS:1 n=1 Tax=Dentiscutata erythropus TaxID=1348616 RepID=A0A9N9I346_9GLOM|nr:17474_t:CDS:2 [Dentiscutata erythropus]